MDLQSNPPLMYSCFNKVVATGGHALDDEDGEDDEDINLEDNSEI